ncbi:MAG: NADPH-dependent assimilatory sulfite reductase hemoprotein subunit [Chloroflexi bacterium AL-W]|nr:NADPH-dependent assimilatory sulfite reductase hemoprotein subunit [Chloroflexi bacterium AL-N1]NOK67102.1 NADPH-dependent assimilatory sulfite reductase hemoprotein subunit [Chloroflexi bacterium AL-N10]NOK74605.1 NADPH-dependent assimilatory sulfite reductase hemoprotein subunit [Chloroflexi bacterium AL-N5]NOK81704.1 NADPH-dependent assimilatory sulfite reductase hemoprotein subunit [Chloroflexi bacterium AL-W]NOK89174.1 NADPH-dependent assimilatory sulfite reductase hemoprotein subunit [
MSDKNKANPTKVEQLKVENDGLGGLLFDEITDTTSDHISESAYQLLKFHGSYQQDDRDLRKERKQQGLDRDWQFMVRTKTPGGRMTAEQYVLADELASTYGNQTLRITTRQGIQFHGIGKSNLKNLIRALNERWITTYGACGDVARNTMTCPVADLLPGNTFDYQALAQEISDQFLPESTAYYELWLDGEKILADGKHVQVTPKREESFYGPTYLPRKHKMSIGLPHDNCIDIFTHDLSLEAVLDDEGTLQGFNLLAGGGLGSTHGKSETFPRLADRIGFLPPEQAVNVLKTATAVYRDYGDRTNRRHARLKYVLDEKGVPWFQDELAQRLGEPLAPAASIPKYDVHDHLGWQQQADGQWMVGVWVEHGRVKDDEKVRVKAGLRAIVEEIQPEVRLTAHHNVILVNIPTELRPRVEALLTEYDLSTGNGSLSALRRYAMACPAMPTCGLAVAESERYLPHMITELEQRGYGDERIWIRMSGCPNSCSRPPTAEIGIIGRSLNLYSVYVGGSFEGTRLAQLYQDKVRSEDLVDLLAGMFDQWREERTENEAFGDWAARVLVPINV